MNLCVLVLFGFWTGASLSTAPPTVVPDAGVGELFPADVLGVVFPPPLPGDQYDGGVFGA